LAACEVVGHGILVVGDVGNPIVGIDVVDAEGVEGIDADPDVLEGVGKGGAKMAVFVVQQTVGEADIDTLVG